MNIGIPQILIIFLWALGIGIEAAKHGQPKTGNHNFITQLIAVGISFTILYFGGFFS